jgi:CRISPR/Cas system-associated exonuclease Cas4 (RecB family)
MKIIRASEIGTYQFCQRAWWYQLQGYEPENKAEMTGGSELHEKHGRVVMASTCVQLIAYSSLLLAVITATIWIILTLT